MSMRAFAHLLDRLSLTSSRNAKLTLIEDHLRQTPDPDRGYALVADRWRGKVGALRLDSSTIDGSSATWEAFVGVGPTQAERRRGANGITGRNIWIYS